MARERSYHQKTGKSKPNRRNWGEVNRSAISRLLGEEVKDATEEYLTGDRNQAIVQFGLVLNQSKINKIRPFLKKSIHSYVKHFRKDFEGSVEIKTCVYDMFRDFNMTDFVERSWQYRPYYIHSTDYTKLQQTRKNPIHITNYDYTQPLYKLSNNIDYNPRDLKRARIKDIVKNDVKFYISQDEKMVFAKIINLKYRPSDLKAIKQHNKDLNEEEREFAVYDNYLYNRSLSISMYVLLDGDPNKAMPYIRYDNDPTDHENLYIGMDKRQDVFKKKACGPHFHFQTEDDSLLCLRKFKGEDGKTKYKTGRCNAINCANLKEYLLNLDAMTEKELESQLRQNLDYGMPFLQYKLDNRKIGQSVDHLFYKFIEDKDDYQMNLLDDLLIWLTTSKDAKVYNRGLCFDKFIRGLDFLDVLHANMQASRDYAQRKLFSQLEIVIADSVLNAISNNTSKYVLQDQAPKFTIETDLYERE